MISDGRKGGCVKNLYNEAKPMAQMIFGLIFPRRRDN
jgi:hypothetical protein